MGASIIAYWPGITEEQLESQPGFHNDDRAWGNMMAEFENASATVEAIRKLDATAILTYKTDGLDDEDVEWVTPVALRTAAERIRDATTTGTPNGMQILKTYELGANNIDPLIDEFLVDLEDIIELTRWADSEGATRMTLDVNW